MNKVLETLRHYQGTVAAVVICVLLVVWGLGCAVTTTSPFDPSKKVTARELDVEVNAYADRTVLAYEDIKRKEQIRATILEAGLAYAQGGGINPLGVISTLAGIVGVGSVIDNRRKDSVIKSKSNALAAVQKGPTDDKS